MDHQKLPKPANKVASFLEFAIDVVSLTSNIDIMVRLDNILRHANTRNNFACERPRLVRKRKAKACKEETGQGL